MGFLQIIEGRTSKMDELTALDDEWQRATEGKRTLQRSFLARDRNDENRFFVLAFFESHEAAMENSSLPETGQFAERMQALLDGPAVFSDLDILDERS